MNKLNWKTIYDVLYDKDEKKLISKNSLNKSNNSNLDDYILINFEDLQNLKKGCHIKYIKNTENGEKILNGGFLINIEISKIPILTKLILKSNIIWKLNFYKYKIYAKNIDNFNNTNKIKNILYNNLRNK